MIGPKERNLHQEMQARQARKHREQTTESTRKTSDTDVETSVAAQIESEDTEQFPSSAEAMIHATLGRGGDSAISELGMRFGHDDTVTMLTTALEQRVYRYLVQLDEKENPHVSPYARLLHAVAAEPNEATSEQKRALAEMHRHLIPELNAVLHQLFERIQAGLHPLENEEKLFAALRNGKAGAQTTTSLFGIVASLPEELRGGLQLHAEQPTTIHTAVVRNPFDPGQTQDYWKERIKAREVYGDEHLADVIAARTGSLAYALSDFAIATEANETVSTAYSLLAEWCEEQVDEIEWTSDHITDHPSEEQLEMQMLIRRTHFGHGEGNDVIALLNAAEVIKQENPDLFARMLGIAPNYAGATQGEFESTESEYFGSAFHMAIHRTLELGDRRSNKTMELFYERVRGLLQFDEAQPLLRQYSEKQMATLQQQFGPGGEVWKQIQADPAVMGTAVLPGIIPKLPELMQRYFESQLPSLLESMQTAEWDEEREYMIETLRSGTPNDVIRILKRIPREMIADAEVTEILNERIFNFAPKKTYSWSQTQERPEVGSYGHRGYEGSPGDARPIVREMYVYSPSTLILYLQHKDKKQVANEAGGVARNLREYLWRSAPDDALLIMDFAEDLHLFTNKETFEEVVGDHPDITREQWQKWYGRVAKKYGIGKGIVNTVRKAFRKKEGRSDTPEGALWRLEYGNVEFMAEMASKTRFFSVPFFREAHHGGKLQRGKELSDDPTHILSQEVRLVSADPATNALYYYAIAENFGRADFMIMHGEESPMLNFDSPEQWDAFIEGLYPEDREGMVASLLEHPRLRVPEKIFDPSVSNEKFARSLFSLVISAQRYLNEHPSEDIETLLDEIDAAQRQLPEREGYPNMQERMKSKRVYVITRVDGGDWVPYSSRAWEKDGEYVYGRWKILWPEVWAKPTADSEESAE